MINKYPFWKNLIVVGAIALGFIYALPNIYPPDYALQVSGESSGAAVSERTLTAVTESLDAAGLTFFSPEIVDGKAQVRLPDDDTQIKALAVVERALHDLSGEYVVAMNTAPTTPDWLANLNAEPMKYGLDLRGGVHFLLEVNTAKVISDRIETLETDVKRKLREAKIRYSNVSSTAPQVLRAAFATGEIRDEARTLLASQYREFEMLSIDDGEPAITMTLTNAMIREIEDFAISQNIQTTRNRVNELGVSEPLVQRLGRNRIVVDLPGVQDPAIAKNILGKVATLEFRMEAQPSAPRSTTINFDYEGRLANLERKIVVRGDRVIDAKAGFDPETSQPQVNITLDSEGGELMHRATRNDIGRRLGVVFIETKTRDSYQMVDGVEVKIQKPYVEKRVISLATVQAALGVQFRITGLEPGEARDLALLLRAGALAAEMFIAEERTVGASLGQENIELGAISVTVGLGLVLLFMLIYYKVFGFAANIALMANLVLLIAVMSSIG